MPPNPTIRMHRFEVFAAVVIPALMAVSALVGRSHLINSSPPVACWEHAWDDEGGQTRACEDVFEAWGPVTEEAGFLTGFAAALPMVVAIFLACRSLAGRSRCAPPPSPGPFRATDDAG